jgi:hypothetical protein
MDGHYTTISAVHQHLDSFNFLSNLNREDTSETTPHSSNLIDASVLFSMSWIDVMSEKYRQRVFGYETVNCRDSRDIILLWQFRSGLPCLTSGTIE